MPRPEAIGEVVRPYLRFREGNAVTFYEQGRDALAAMLEAIREARTRVHLETYILRSDHTGRRFLDALAERARSGVTVRLLIDGFGSRGVDPAALAGLRRAGGDVVVFNPLHRFMPRWLPRRRDHRKILTVDGAVAFTGGLNVGDEYWDGHGGAGGWRDTHLAVRGPLVRDLEAVFLEGWFRADGPDLAWDDLLAETPAPAGHVRGSVLPDGPVYRRRRVRDLMVAALRGARRRARLSSPYFAPGGAVLDALEDAARRGVEIDLVVAGEPTDHPLLRRAAHALFPPLFARGVRVHEYEGAMMHAKVALFDDRFAIVGSSNLDRQSLRHSYEINLVLEGQEVIARLGATFEADLARARVLDPRALARRGPVERWLDRLAALVLRIL